ncbi:DinB family protein [Microvirga sp. STS02]|uniref:DinB family protein n=1 Tax=Hymenobacter negativus TaxID=2795026 RepID=UPI0018DCFFA2|nr:MULTISPECIES: DinB family protein [Bacteria]MBH8570090.1 DinB family protein [Hymenobacter negativus]MBR7209830.1 DinB family protein [Microvirga sp. STS02]
MSSPTFPSAPPPETREVWLRGPLPDMPPLLQPVAHALLQAREELTAAMQDFPPALLNERPGGVASVGFHLQHLAGVLDRIFTYARGEALLENQLAALAAENPPLAIEADTVQKLVQRFSAQVDRALTQLCGTEEATLPEARGVGRAQLPSTVIGLLMHAAEHTTRHLGQLLVTAKWVRSDA